MRTLGADPRGCTRVGAEGTESDHQQEVGTMTTVAKSGEGRGRAGEAMTAEARPQPRSLIGKDGQHRLVRSGYMVVTVCRSCGAPLTSARSVARQIGPACSKRVVG